VAELNATNDTPLRTYAWAGGFDSLLWVNDRTGGQTNSHFVAYDGNANVRALVDASTGLSSAEYDYGPFGDVIRATGPMALKNPIRFSSKYQDPESGLLYYGYRYYSAQHQKWLSRDPISYEGGLNLYAFVGNDPVNGADELGLYSSLNFVPAAELAWMLGANAAFDTGVSIAMQKALADPCDRDWLDWGQVGKDVGIGAAIAITTAGTGKAVQLYRMSKRAKAVGEAAELAAKGQYDDLARVLSQHGDDFGEAVVAHNRARAAANAASANRVARAAGNAGQASSLAGRASGTTAIAQSLEMQRQIAQKANRVGAAVDRWLMSAGAASHARYGRWAQTYQAIMTDANATARQINYAKGIRGRFVDRRMSAWMESKFRAQYPAMQLDQALPGSTLRPDVYFPDLGGRSVIFDFGGPSKVEEVLKYSGMAEDVIPIVPTPFVR
jgi:RHS repeat-associated protein